MPLVLLSTFCSVYNILVLCFCYCLKFEPAFLFRWELYTYFERNMYWVLWKFLCLKDYLQLLGSSP
jgi:hypothetical protein